MAALQVESVSIQELSLPAVPEGPFTVELLIEGQPQLLQLTPHSIRTPGFQLLVQRADGSLEQRAPLPSCTFRGSLLGLPGSKVAASIFDGGLTATIRPTPGAPAWCVVPVASLGIDSPAPTHAVYHSPDAQIPQGQCAVATPGRSMRPELKPASTGSGAMKICEVAVDCDTQFFIQSEFSEAVAQADVESILNASSLIYETDSNIILKLSALVVRTFEPDPYSSYDINFLLSQFIGEWTTTLADVPRDVAQLFTGKETGTVIGVAYLNTVCHFGQGYSVVRPNYTGHQPSRVALTTHEIGHNWSAGHCDSDADCKIMCSIAGACSGDVESFGTSSKNIFENAKAGYPCLEDEENACGFSGYGEALLNPAQLSATGVGSIGTTFTLTYSSPSQAPSSALTLVSTERGSTALGSFVLLLELGAIVGRTPAVHFLSSTDTPSQTFYLADEPALVGAEFFFQALHFSDPSPSLSTLDELSNGVRLEICP